ncbi:MAG: hypothetical protein N0E48_17040 [Candidatus Thiodiazotropha endolucinida]|nr:hypothetical protein [Candidatus Thiodiazotropha endolucinida]
MLNHTEVRLLFVVARQKKTNKKKRHTPLFHFHSLYKSSSYDSKAKTNFDFKYLKSLLTAKNMATGKDFYEGLSNQDHLIKVSKRFGHMREVTMRLYDNDKLWAHLNDKLRPVGQFVGK